MALFRIIAIFFLLVRGSEAHSQSEKGNVLVFSF